MIVYQIREAGMKTIVLSLALVILTSSNAVAALKSEIVAYKQGDVVMRGYLTYDDSIADKRPGIIVFPEWWGLNDYVRMRADMLAKLGFVAFAADVYGGGIVAKDAQEAGALATKYKSDRPLLRDRAEAALAAVKALPFVDSGRVAAIGYCFGGTAALELARNGADIKAVASFHGSLNTPSPQDASNIRAKILVLHGADDPFVPSEEVRAFEKEMKDATVSYELIEYPGAVHGFTNPANNGEIPGALYNVNADKKSWQAMKDFLDRNL
jgi:dienelactone hydrolase